MQPAVEAPPRPAGPFDIDVMAAIHAASFPAADAWGRDVFGLHLAMPTVFGLLHPAGGLIVVRVAADQAEILTLAVHPQARRHGVGLMLLRQGIATATGRGARTMFLEVSVTNIAAQALYTNVGFVRAGYRPQYYSDRSDALVLRLDLDSTA